MLEVKSKCDIKNVIKGEAKYIIRFDDLCPTMNWDVWDKLESILLENNIKPLIAVVPNNQDKKLVVDNAKSDFWEKVAFWQKKGWTIALHGYNHVYENHKSGIMGGARNSEFVSLPYDIQHQKISRGIGIFNEHNIETDTWIAPSQSFDKTTLNVLKEYAIKIISAGFSRKPFFKNGFLWIPCQIWDNIFEKKNGAMDGGYTSK